MGERSLQVRKHVYIEDEHEEYLEQTEINFSQLVREAIEDRMEKDGFEVEK